MNKSEVIEIIEREKEMVSNNKFLTPLEKDNKIKELNELINNEGSKKHDCSKLLKKDSIA